MDEDRKNTFELIIDCLRLATWLDIIPRCREYQL